MITGQAAIIDTADQLEKRGLVVDKITISSPARSMQDV